MSSVEPAPETRPTVGQRIKNLHKNKPLMIGLFIIGLLIALFIAIVPWKKYDAEDYFTQYEKHKINGDVEQLVGKVETFLQLEPDDFLPYENYPLSGYKYSVAFAGYGLANVAFIEPSRRQQMIRDLDKTIDRYYQYAVQQDWWTEGYGPDANLTGNVMYRGHLNMLYGLYELIATDKKYEEKFKELTKKIVDEVESSKNGRGHNYFGMVCEPANYYVECNTISVYSIKLHDKLYGTDHSQLIDNWFKYITTDLTDRETGLFCMVYHPTTDYPVPTMISYNNGWALLFLNALYPEFTQSKYATYKAKFIKDFFWYAYAINGGPIEEIRKPVTVNSLPYLPGPPARQDDFPDGIGSLFAFFLASEVKDADLYNKILNGLSKVGTVPVDSHSPAGIIVVDVANNLALQGPILFGKTNIGLARLLELAEQKRLGNDALAGW